MNAALWISKTGLSAQDAEMSAIANNIANVNTTGFKRDRVMFQDLFYQTQEAPGAMLDQNNIMPTGMQFVAVYALSVRRKPSPKGMWKPPTIR